VLVQGLTLTIIGMLVVFIILILLVFVMKLLSAVVFRFFPEPEVPVQPQQSAGNVEIAVAIAAAYAKKNQ
jgi:oxaloacetate decarboxylase (Na+ extruding) subunit gamma